MITHLNKQEESKIFAWILVLQNQKTKQPKQKMSLFAKNQVSVKNIEISDYKFVFKGIIG